MNWPFKRRRKPTKLGVTIEMVESDVPAQGPPSDGFRLRPGEAVRVAFPPVLNEIIWDLQARGAAITTEQTSVELNGERMIEMAVLADGEVIATMKVTAVPVKEGKHG